jgi:L-fuculose-phosphate aldolase
LSLAVEKAKEQLVKMGLAVVQANLVLGSWGNLSYRVGRDDVVVITPSGLDYSRLHAKDMVVVDLEGAPVEGYLRPSTELPMHLAVYHSRPDVHAVIHTHSPYASGLAVARLSIPPILEDLVSVVGGTVPVTDYAPAGSVQLADITAAALKNVNAVLLANHGVVGVGDSMEEAFQVCRVVEKAAQVLVFARMVGSPVPLAEGDIQALRDFYRSAYGQR